MKYHKCQAAGCTTKMSDGTPVLCPKHQQPENMDFHESVVRPFRDWAQQYLDGGRWAGYDYFTAIKTELLERDAQVDAIENRLKHISSQWQARAWKCACYTVEESSTRDEIITKSMIAGVLYSCADEIREIISKHE